MKITLFSILILMASLGLSLCSEGEGAGADNAAAYYYYANGTKVYLQPDAKRVVLGFDNELISNDQLLSWLTAENLELIDGSHMSTANILLVTCSGRKNERKMKKYLADLRNEPFITYAYPWFTSVGQESSVLIPTNEILFAPKPGVSQAELNALLNEKTHHLELDDQYGNFIVRLNAQSEACVWEVANYLYESGHVSYAYPNFIAAVPH